MKKFLPYIALILLFFIGLQFGTYEFYPRKPIQRNIIVHIEGEIQKPGVYEVDENHRLGEVIEVAGGLTEKADGDRINLAKRLTDGEKIVIHSSISDIEGQIKKDSVISLQNITKDQWLEVQGVGESTAEKILEYVRENPSASWENLLEIDGIGEKKLWTIKEHFMKKN